MESPSKLSPLSYTRVLYSFLVDIFIFKVEILPLSLIGLSLLLFSLINIVKSSKWTKYYSRLNLSSFLFHFNQIYLLVVSIMYSLIKNSPIFSITDHVIYVTLNSIILFKRLISNDTQLKEQKYKFNKLSYSTQKYYVFGYICDWLP